MYREENDDWTVRWSSFETRVYVSTKLSVASLDLLIGTLKVARDAREDADSSGQEP